MTQSRLHERVANAIVTIIAALFVASATGLWSSKESVSDHNADMEKMHGQLERIIDVICDKPENAKPRACTQTPQVVRQFAP